MKEHRKVLGILNLVWGALSAVTGIMLFFLFGGVASFINHSAGDPDAQIAVTILGFMAVFLFVLLCVLALPTLIAGYGLIQGRSWAPTLGIVVSALHLLNIPFGTILGIYGFWVLLPRSRPGPPVQT
jgi:uncharacterized membrane protein